MQWSYHKCLPNNRNIDSLKFRLSIAQGLVEKHGSCVPCPVHGCPSNEPPPKRLTERHFHQRKEGMTSKKMFGVQKIWEKERIYLLV
jgi:hypothetical protein